MSAAVTATRAIVSHSMDTSTESAAAEPETARAADAADRAVMDPAPPESRTYRSATGLPIAPFVAQLIATQQGLPQTRARNRAAPAVAALAYRITGRRN